MLFFFKIMWWYFSWWCMWIQKKWSGTVPVQAKVTLGKTMTHTHCLYDSSIFTLISFTYDCQKGFSWVCVMPCLPESRTLCLCSHNRLSISWVVAAFLSNLSQGVGLFCSDIADCLYSFEWLVTLHCLGRGERYGEGQECLYLRIPAGTDLVISNQNMNHPASERKCTVLKYNIDRLTLQAKW